MRNFVTFVLIVILALATVLAWFKISISPRSASTEFKTFVIPQGASLAEIAKSLKKDGLIKNALSFRILAQVSGLAKKIQAGQYELSPSQSASVILDELTSGTFDVWVTIPEGWRVEEIGGRLEQKLGIKASEFVKIAREGFMFPDTYLIPKKATAADVVNIMLNNFYKKVDTNLQNEIRKSGLKLDQVLILASIVEREVKFDSDRPIVAGILLERWRQNLPLEADASVQYAAGFQPAEKSWWKKTLTAEDLKIDSPYNTRKFARLPPAPICNPGLSSVKAVVAPTKTVFFYYLSDRQGKIHYAKTLDEHIENVKNYL